MSDSKTIFVPFEGEGRDRAVLLLEAAEKKDLEPGVVRTTLGGFLVPEEVEQEAFGGKYAKAQADEEKAREKAIEDARDTELESEPVTREDNEKPKAAKKAAAKKATTSRKDN